jgi:hypothetical protein
MFGRAPFRGPQRRTCRLGRQKKASELESETEHNCKCIWNMSSLEPFIFKIQK